MAFPPSTGYRSFRDHLGPQNWRALLDIGAQVRFEPGQTVLNQGEEGNHVLAVVRGVCKVVAARPDRGQVLLAVRGPGDTLGEFAVVDRQPRSASVYAVTDVRAHVLRDAEFTAFLHRRRLDQMLTSYLSMKLRSNSSMVSELAGVPVKAKVAWLLCRLVAVSATAGFVPLYQHDLAELLGVARSSVAASLADFRAEGLLRTESGGVHLLDVDALSRHVQSSRQ